MSPKRARSPGARLPAFLLAVCLAGSAHAASYKLRPEITVEQTFDDNVLSAENEVGQPDKEVSSWGTRFSPTVTLTRKSETSEATIVGGLVRRNTYSLSEINGTDRRLGGGVRRTLSPRLSMGAQANYWFYSSFDAIDQAGVNGNPQVLFDERPELTTQSYSSDLTYALDDVTELTGTLQWNDWRYGDSDLTDLFDTTDGTVSLELTRRITDSDRVGVALSYTVTDEELSESRTFAEPSTENRLGMALVSWQRAWSPRWSTNLQAGARALDSEFELKRAVNGDFFGPPLTPPCIGVLISDNFCYRNEKTSDSGTGFIGGGSIDYAYSSRGQVSLGYMHDTRTGMTSSTGSSAVDSNRFSVTATHKLTRRVWLTLNGTYYAYVSTDDGVVVNNFGIPSRINDTSTTRMHLGSVRLDWQLRKDVTVYATFNYFDFDQARPQSFSNPERDYVRRVYGVGFRYFFDLPDREP